MKTFFLEVIQKKVFMIFVGENCKQKLHKNFSDKFGEIRGKSFALQKFACSYTYACGSMTGSYCSLKACNITIQHSTLACSGRRNDILQVICGILFCYDMRRKALIMWRRSTQRSLQLRAVVRWGRADELDTELHTVHALSFFKITGVLQLGLHYSCRLIFCLVDTFLF